MIKTEWEQYKSNRHSQLGGVYMFLFKDFRYVPYLVGQTGNYLGRFNQHDNDFAAGGRTFMRPCFTSGTRIRTHKGFVEHWHSSRQRNNRRLNPELVYGTDTPGEQQIIDEGVAYGQNSRVILVCPIAADDEERCRIETGVQKDIMEYLDWLLGEDVDWSKLFGQPSSRRPYTKIHYSWARWRNFVWSVDFFRAVEIATSR